MDLTIPYGKTVLNKHSQTQILVISSDFHWTKNPQREITIIVIALLNWNKRATPKYYHGFSHAMMTTEKSWECNQVIKIVAGINFSITRRMNCALQTASWDAACCKYKMMKVVSFGFSSTSVENNYLIQLVVRLERLIYFLRIQTSIEVILTLFVS